MIVDVTVMLIVYFTKKAIERVKTSVGLPTFADLSQKTTFRCEVVILYEKNSCHYDAVMLLFLTETPQSDLPIVRHFMQ